MICMACMPPRTLEVHYSHQALAVLRWVNGDRRFASTGWMLTRAPVLLTKDEQKWCLNTCWINKDWAVRMEGVE